MNIELYDKIKNLYLKYHKEKNMESCKECS